MPGHSLTGDPHAQEANCDQNEMIVYRAFSKAGHNGEKPSDCVERDMVQPERNSLKLRNLGSPVPGTISRPTIRLSN